jgi:colanic acid/amylovoran biosynthesis glycosyltransferase
VSVHPSLRLVYIIGTYPILTTTFIDREIDTLFGWNVDVAILAMRRPDSSIPFTSEQQRLQARTIYLLPARIQDILASQLYFLLRHPHRFLATLAWLLSRPHPSLAARCKTFLHFGEGVLAAYVLRDRTFEEFHAHFADRAATVALVGGRLLGKPYSLSIHTGADIYVKPVLLAEKISKARAVTTCTSFNQTYLDGLLNGGQRPAIHHVRHGLDLSKYSPAPVRGEQEPTILSVGQL